MKKSQRRTKKKPYDQEYVGELAAAKKKTSNRRKQREDKRTDHGYK